MEAPEVSLRLSYSSKLTAQRHLICKQNSKQRSSLKRLLKFFIINTSFFLTPHSYQLASSSSIEPFN